MKVGSNKEYRNRNTNRKSKR